MDMRPFEQWMIGQGVNEKTRRDLLSRCDRICRCEQCDLDEEWDKDRCAHILGLFTYTVADERAGRSPNHHVTIDGNVRTGTSALRAALVKYVNFKNKTSGEMISLKEDGDEVAPGLAGRDSSTNCNDKDPDISVDEEDESDDDSDYDADERPFDPAEIDIDAKDITVFSLLERIRSKEIILDTDYQRNSNLWNRYRQSQLIESMLLGIPIPTFYFAIDADFKDELGLMRQSWQVVDGLQRLCVIRNFMVGYPEGSSRCGPVMRLKGMQYLRSLDNKSYDELPEALKRTLLEVNIKANIIRKSTPLAVKLNIFRRLNTGGLPLSMQEIRHAMHSNGSAQLLKRLASSDDFKNATQNRVSCRRMGDREFVNRFLAFYLLGVESYGGMDVFLEESLAKIDRWVGSNQQALNGVRLEEDARVRAIENDFVAALQTMHKAFGDDAYCQLDPSKQQVNDRRRINKALFEVFTVCVARMSMAARWALVEAAEMVRIEYRKLFEDRLETGLSNLVSVSTGNKSRVFKRYEIVSAFLARMTGEQVEWRNGLYD